MLIAKYSAIYSLQGILFMSISPGVVNTGEGKRTPRKPSHSNHTPTALSCRTSQPSYPPPTSLFTEEVSFSGQSLIFLATPDELEKLMPMFGKFKELDPNFAGPITSEASVEMVMKVVYGATVEKDGGSFVSHHRDKNWL